MNRERLLRASEEGRARALAPPPPPAAIPSQEAESSRPSRSGGPSRAILALGRSHPYSKSKPRRPRADAVISNNRYRPHVLAKDRLRLWVAPFATRVFDDAASALSPAASSQLLEVLLASLDEATHASYAADLLRFHQFCDKLSVSEDARMPASEILLAAFAAHSAGEVSGKTVSNWLSGVRAWHRISFAPWHGGKALAAVHRGAVKLTPASSIREKRPPATLRHMGAMHARLDPTNPRDAAILGAAGYTFWGCCRLGELLVPSHSQAHDAFKFVRRGSRAELASSFRTTEAGVDFFKFHIPWTKTTAEDGADIIITRRRGNPLCPIASMRLHLEVNKSVPASAPLFAYATPTGSLPFSLTLAHRALHLTPTFAGWEALTKEAFMARCNEVVVATGLPPIFGHSFRIGGATELLLMGVEPDVVRVQGRWMSDAFLEYWRKIDEILPLFLSQSHEKQRVAVLCKSIGPYLARHRPP
jgi:hypothetical protein